MYISTYLYKFTTYFYLFLHIYSYFHVYFYLFLHIYSYFQHVEHYIYYYLPRRFNPIFTPICTYFHDNSTCLMYITIFITFIYFPKLVKKNEIKTNILVNKRLFSIHLYTFNYQCQFPHFFCC